MKHLPCLIFLGGMAISTPLLAKDAKAPVTVQLDVVSTSPALTVHLHFTNTTSHEVYLSKSRMCAVSDAKNVFQITSGKEKIRYTGALDQVKPQFPADYIRLAPKSSYDVTTVISRYAFLPGEQTYSLSYSTDMWDKSQKKRFILTSNAVTTTFKAS